MVPRNGQEPGAPRLSPAGDGLHERIDVLGRPGGDDRPVGAGRMPALPRRPWLGEPGGLADAALLPEPVALEADDDRLVLAPLAGPLQRFEVHRQVRLEVVLECAPAIADARRERRPGSCL